MSEQSGKFPFPGISTTADGTGTVVTSEVLASTGAAAYPITPSTNMGVGYQQAVADGAKNAWGGTLAFVEPESEHSAASACEGYALAGGRVANFTAGQGLILMKEVLYTICGKRLPMVFNIGARALTHHSLNVHAGHDDVMGVADCGWGMLFARNAQEAGDLNLIARKTSEDSFTPFFNIQDGFLTTHTVENVKLCEAELVKAYLRDPKGALHNFMDTEHPVTSGTVQNQDAYMRGKIAQRGFYAPIKGNLKKNMEEFYKLTGRKYELIHCYKMEDAEYAIVGMGSYMETAMATADWVRKNQGVKVGVITVISYRPFPGSELVSALKNVKAVSVLERMDECSALENPLARDLKAAFTDAMWGHEDYDKITKLPVIQHGAGGLGSRDVTSKDFIAIVENLKKGAKGKIRYAVGITHEDGLAWDGQEPDIRPEGSFSMRGHSIGGYGAVTTNKLIATICADLFKHEVQAYPKYGAEKKGLPTTFYLTLANSHINLHHELSKIEFVVVQDGNAFKNSNPLAGLTDEGALFIQTKENDPAAIWKTIPEKMRLEIKKRKIHVYALDATAIAREVASTPDLVQRMQGVVLLGMFLRVTPFARRFDLSPEKLMQGVEKAIRKYFGKRGERVVQDNMNCVRNGYDRVIEVPRNIIEA